MNVKLVQIIVVNKYKTNISTNKYEYIKAVISQLVISIQGVSF